MKFQKVGGQKKYFKYKECEAGQELVVGKYLGRSPNQFGNENFDFAPLEEGPVVSLNYAGQLNYLIENFVSIGDIVKVIYAGQVTLDKGAMKGKNSHQFEVEVAEGDSVQPQPMQESKPVERDSEDTVDLSDLD